MLKIDFLELFNQQATPQVLSRNCGSRINPGEVVQFSFDEFGFCEHKITYPGGKIPWYRKIK